MRSDKPVERARRSAAPAAGAKPQRRSPLPPESSAGEEDPGASLGDPAMQDAMREEAKHAAQHAEDGAAARQAEQSRTALDNVRKGYGGKRR